MKQARMGKLERKAEARRKEGNRGGGEVDGEAMVVRSENWDGGNGVMQEVKQEGMKKWEEAREKGGDTKTTVRARRSEELFILRR